MKNFQTADDWRLLIIWVKTLSAFSRDDKLLPRSHHVISCLWAVKNKQDAKNPWNEKSRKNIRRKSKHRQDAFTHKFQQKCEVLLGDHGGTGNFVRLRLGMWLYGLPCRTLPTARGFSGQVHPMPPLTWFSLLIKHFSKKRGFDYIKTPVVNC